MIVGENKTKKENKLEIVIDFRKSELKPDLNLVSALYYKYDSIRIYCTSASIFEKNGQYGIKYITYSVYDNKRVTCTYLFPRFSEIESICFNSIDELEGNE